MHVIVFPGRQTATMGLGSMDLYMQKGPLSLGRNLMQHVDNFKNTLSVILTGIYAYLSLLFPFHVPKHSEGWEG